MTQPTPDLLTGILGEIAEAVSVEVALALAREFGGQRLYLPQALHPDHPLCVFLGRDQARSLLAFMGAGSFLVPMAKKFSDEARGQEIAKMLAQGQGYNQIAKALHIHVRTVERWALKCRDQSPHTPDLFSRKK